MLSNEGNKWRQSEVMFQDDLTLIINISEKFIGEGEGLVLSKSSGYWRWLGIQFVISDR